MGFFPFKSKLYQLDFDGTRKHDHDIYNTYACNMSLFREYVLLKGSEVNFYMNTTYDVTTIINVAIAHQPFAYIYKLCGRSFAYIYIQTLHYYFIQPFCNKPHLPKKSVFHTIGFYFRYHWWTYQKFITNNTPDVILKVALTFNIQTMSQFGN